MGGRKAIQKKDRGGTEEWGFVFSVTTPARVSFKVDITIFNSVKPGDNTTQNNAPFDKHFFRAYHTLGSAI